MVRYISLSQPARADCSAPSLGKAHNAMDTKTTITAPTMSAAIFTGFSQAGAVSRVSMQFIIGR
jgi:hypothetical protein